MNIKINFCGECPFLINCGAEYYTCWLNTDIHVDDTNKVNHECSLLKEDVVVSSAHPVNNEGV